MEIPENKYDMEGDINKAVDCVLAALKRETTKYKSADVLRMNHGISVMDERTEMGVTMPVALAVADRFKAKGYFAHFCRSIQGTPYCLSITTYPTNHDI